MTYRESEKKSRRSIRKIRLGMRDAAGKTESIASVTRSTLPADAIDPKKKHAAGRSQLRQSARSIIGG